MAPIPERSAASAAAHAHALVPRDVRENGDPPAGPDRSSTRVFTHESGRPRLRDLWAERALISIVAQRDIKVKYKQSLLGRMWLVIQPVALLVGFVVVFGRIASVETNGIPYVLFALVGLTIWSYFQATMTLGAASVVSNYNLVRWTPSPRIAFPAASLFSSLPSLAITLAATLIIGLLVGWRPGLRFLLLPLCVLWLLVFVGGLVFLVSAAAVRFRDVLNALPFVLQVGLFVTPVGYSTANLSHSIAVVLSLNPLVGMIEAWRWCFFTQAHPSAVTIGVSAVMTLLTGAAGWSLFRRLQPTMADVI